MRITEPGVYEMPAEEYHADPCPAPSLSASVGTLAVMQTPRHAWAAHPKLNPRYEPGEPTAVMEEGTALHAAILERRSIVVPVDAPDWRSKAAQEIRAKARADGMVAILAHRWEEIGHTAEAIRTALREHEVGDVFAAGAAERVLAWQEETDFGPIWCRARADFLPDGLPDIADLKTTSASAEPGRWGLRMDMDGRAFTAAWYLRGAAALKLQRHRYRFIVAETAAPNGVSVCELAPDLRAIAEQQVEEAIQAWGYGLHRGIWPCYPRLVVQIEAHGAALMRSEEKRARAEQIKRRPFAGGSTHLAAERMPFA